jgi:hypothetical protein
MPAVGSRLVNDSTGYVRIVTELNFGADFPTLEKEGCATKNEAPRRNLVAELSAPFRG